MRLRRTATRTRPARRRKTATTRSHKLVAARRLRGLWTVHEVLSPLERVDIEAGKTEIAQGKWVDWDDLKKELDL